MREIKKIWSCGRVPFCEHETKFDAWCHSMNGDIKGYSRESYTATDRRKLEMWPELIDAIKFVKEYLDTGMPNHYEASIKIREILAKAAELDGNK